MNTSVPELRIACVEYYNTLPFIYGLEHLLTSEVTYQLNLAPPAACTELYASGKVDVALVPVGGLDRLTPDYRILPHTCIGCDGAVDTVAILSQCPIEEITSLHLDPHSNTSNKLVQILCKEHWNIAPQFPQGVTSYDQESLLAIGDKVFDLESNYSYKYDLGEVWKAYSGLPFVFAVWIVRNHIPISESDHLGRAYLRALDYPDRWIPDGISISRERLNTYLTKNIVFRFDDYLREGLHLFQNLSKKTLTTWTSTS